MGRDGHARRRRLPESDSPHHEGRGHDQVRRRKNPEIKIIGKPTYCIAFTSDKVDIFHVNDFMAERGWRFNGLQRPPGFHLCVTPAADAPGSGDAFRA